MVKDLKVDGKLVETELDNTIKSILKRACKSGDSITFTMNFKTYFDTGSLRRRMKTFNAFGNKHYDGVAWYPRIAVYDAKFDDYRSTPWKGILWRFRNLGMLS